MGLIVCLSSPVPALGQGGAVTGIVVDSENRPVSDVFVFLDEAPVWAPTDGELIGVFQQTGEAGAFALEGVSAGTHLLNFRRAGFEPRTFNLEFEPGEGRRDVGVVVLEEGRDPTATVEGRITDGVSGEPLSNVVVKLNGDVVALTDGNGGFRLSEAPIVWGFNEFEVGRFAFTTLTSEFWVLNPDETLDFSGTLDPLPIDVGGVVANVARPPDVPARLEPFYERLNRTAGEFVTRSIIDSREPRAVTDVLRGISGLRLRPGPYGMMIVLRRPAIGFRNSLNFSDDTGCASPLIFLDGLFLGGAEQYININDLVDPDEVEGIEVYNSAAQVPTEFNRPGSACGVVGIWTR